MAKAKEIAKKKENPLISVQTTNSEWEMKWIALVQ